MNEQPLVDSIEKVKTLRHVEEAKIQELHELQVEFNQQHKDLIEALCKAKSDRDQEEVKLRELTLEAYRQTGNKKPAKGVGIRVVKVMEYDEDKALHWAVAMGFMSCLQLDKKNFGKVAEGLGPDFCEIKEVPQATISKEL